MLVQIYKGAGVCDNPDGKNLRFVIHFNCLKGLQILLYLLSD